MSTTAEPFWLTVARRDIGQREGRVPNDAPFLRVMWARLSALWLLGQPWCGGILADWMQQAGIAFPKTFYRAKSWLEWGQFLGAPAVGAVVIFDRKGGGHVGIVVGRNSAGYLLVLGGNQGDAVSIAPFDPSRVLGYRWPADRLAPDPAPLPVYAVGGPLSTNEA